MKFINRQRGVSGLSYAVMIGLVAVVAIVGVTLIGRNVSALFQGVANRTAAAGNVSGPGGGGSTPGPDTVPDAFGFAPASNAALSSPVQSDIVQITGLTAPAAVSYAGAFGDAGWRSCADSACASVISAYATTAGTISNGQYVQLSALTSGVSGESRGVTLTIGGVNGSWTIGNADTVPDNFSFTATSNATLGAATSSAIVQITGLTGASPVNFSGAGGDAGWRSCSDSGCSVVISAYSTGTGTIMNGQYVQLSAIAPGTPSGNRSVSLTIGGVAANWSITSEAVSCSGSGSSATSTHGTTTLSVPANLASCRFTFVLDGAGGAGGTRSPGIAARGGNGGRMNFYVTPGVPGTFNLLTGRGGQYNTVSSSGLTGGGGGSGQNGGSGGGASAVSFTSSATSTTTVLAVVGGGGGGGYSNAGLAGQGANGGSGGSGTSSQSWGGDGGWSSGNGGGGGGVSSTGSGGAGGSSTTTTAAVGSGGSPSAGSLSGQGGVANSAFLVSGGGGGGFASSGCGSYGSGGGGGGYGGGAGGGCNGNSGPGGGGGAYAHGSITVTGGGNAGNAGPSIGSSNGTPGGPGGNGAISITWAP